MKRGPAGFGENFFGQLWRDASYGEFFANLQEAVMLSPCYIILCVPAVVQEFLLQELLDDLRWSFSKFRLELLRQLRNRIVASAKQPDRITVDFFINSHGFNGLNGFESVESVKSVADSS